MSADQYISQATGRLYHTKGNSDPYMMLDVINKMCFY